MTWPLSTERVADRLIRRACRRLPGDAAVERYREWAAELPAILHDPDIRLAPLRSARALGFAAGISGTTRRLHRSAARGSRTPETGFPLWRVLAGLGIWASAVGFVIVISDAYPDSRSAWPLLPGLAAAVAFVAWCLTDLIRAAEVRFLPKWGWALFCLGSIPLGAIMYVSAGRVRSAGRA